jgi:hypothetical protein
MITTTLKRIKKHRPCEYLWKKLLAGLAKTEADDEPLPFAKIVEINGVEGALWCCRVEPQYAREWRLFAVWCARQVQHLMKDPRSVAALDVAERYARGEATDKELGDARTDAAHFSVVHNVAYAACDDDAALAAYFAALYAADAAAAAQAARAAQTEQFLRVVTETEDRE